MLRKNSKHVIPKGGICPMNLLFLGSREEKQIPRFARDDKKVAQPQVAALLKPISLRSLAGLHRQVCGFPADDAAGEFADSFKSFALQQAGCNRRPVSTRAVN